MTSILRTEHMHLGLFFKKDFFMMHISELVLFNFTNSDTHISLLSYFLIHSIVVIKTYSTKKILRLLVMRDVIPFRRKKRFFSESSLILNKMPIFYLSAGAASDDK